MRNKLLITLTAVVLYGAGFWTARSLLHFQVQMTCRPHVAHTGGTTL